MNSYLKNYKIKLTTLAPVFVGSGRTVKKSEYVYDKGRVYFIDSEKLIERIVASGLTDSYTDALRINSFNIKYWLNSNKIFDYENLSSYILNCRDLISDKDGVQTCIKDAYGNPYIPGSSLKGALRTVILWNGLLNKSRAENDSFRKKLQYALQEKNVKRETGKAEREIEKAVFNRKISYKGKDEDASIMRGIIVGDSKPLTLDDLVLCKKIDVTLDGKENPLNIMRECIAPGRTLEFDLTVDESIFESSAEDIKEMIECYTNDYDDNISCNFTQGEYEENVIFFGGGAGYFSKTVTYNGAIFQDNAETVRFVKTFLGKTTPREHKHFSDSTISPHMQKCTRAGGKMYEMGKCRIEICER